MVRLRGHHLICLNFFQGEGYSGDFIDNVKQLLDMVQKGEKIKVVEGPDDVCSACPYLKGDICTHKEGADEEIKEMDDKARNHLCIESSQEVVWNEIKQKVNSISRSWFWDFCNGCDWQKVCNRMR
ncbi:DUF1284 domain-containing protein [Caldanaerobius polysaccharolyticus]|uniref:DUF1284 domain-containing protein n=1 Tax=Caldanaerobius polysaccharolyticus TaxID=44256 RepID=UPI000479DF34|nr:DUF1284 domain-containing protein [Caldanaerobius polysaccharolyticus]